VPTTPIRQNDHGYLKESRRQVLRAVEGLGEYDLRRPMTATGTNLLGVVKHLIGIEAGYLGVCLDRPLAVPLPWIDDESGGPLRDMWATADEPVGYVLDLYRLAGKHADTVLEDVGPEATAVVAWWPVGERETTAAALVARVLADTAMHAGQLQILRELIDGRAGSDRGEMGDDGWWADHVERLEHLARRFRPEPD
jgi:hypothetical protein